MSQLTPEERSHLAKGKALLEGVPRFLQPAGVSVDGFSATPSQAAIPDCIFGRNLNQGAVVSTRFWTYAQFWNSQDKIGGGREGHDSLCLILPRRGVLNEVSKSMNLWKEVHILLETSTLTPGEDIPSILIKLLPFQLLARIDRVETGPEASYADRKGHATSLRLIAVRCKAGDIQRCFTFVFDCKYVSSCVAPRMRTPPLPLRMLCLTMYINWPYKGMMFRPSLDQRLIGSSFAGTGTPEL